MDIFFDLLYTDIIEKGSISMAHAKSITLTDNDRKYLQNSHSPTHNAGTDYRSCEDPDLQGARER